MGNQVPNLKQNSNKKDTDQISLPVQDRVYNSNLPIRSWTRLGLGIVLLGLDALIVRTRTWEQNVGQPQAATHKTSQEEAPISSQITKSTSLYNKSDISLESSQRQQALIGFIFDFQDRIFRGVSAFHRIEGLADRIISPLISPISKSRLFRPVNNQFNKLASRGQEQVNKWVQIGMAEEIHSRELLITATLSTVDTSIDYLSTNPDVKDLVQSQSTSMINEIIEEIRERTVSADTLVEGIVRAALHLPPRYKLPEPPLEVRMLAVRIRPPKMDKFLEDKGL